MRTRVLLSFLAACTLVIGLACNSGKNDVTGSSALPASVASAMHGSGAVAGDSVGADSTGPHVKWHTFGPGFDKYNCNSGKTISDSTVVTAEGDLVNPTGNHYGFSNMVYWNPESGCAATLGAREDGLVVTPSEFAKNSTTPFKVTFTAHDAFRDAIATFGAACGRLQVDISPRDHILGVVLDTGITCKKVERNPPPPSPKPPCITGIVNGNNDDSNDDARNVVAMHYKWASLKGVCVAKDDKGHGHNYWELDSHHSNTYEVVETGHTHHVLVHPLHLNNGDSFLYFKDESPETVLSDAGRNRWDDVGPGGTASAGEADCGCTYVPKQHDGW